jgi:hypothetical protein
MGRLTDSWPPPVLWLAGLWMWCGSGRACSCRPQEISYCKNGTGQGQVARLLRDEARKYNAEFMTLLDPAKRILVNAGGRNRSGEVWDPDGIVSRVLAKPRWGQVRRCRAGQRAFPVEPSGRSDNMCGWWVSGCQLVFSSVVSWDMLKAEGAPVYRERVLALTVSQSAPSPRHSPPRPCCLTMRGWGCG